MTKKIIGICLIVLGGLIFAACSYGLFQIVFQPDLMKAKTEQQLVEKGFSAEQIEMSMMMVEKTYGTMKIVNSVIAIVGLGIALGGFFLFRKGKKDAQFSDSFKFD